MWPNANIAEPPPTRGVNRDSGTDRANGGWLRRLVSHHGSNLSVVIVLAAPPSSTGQHPNKNVP